MQQLIVKGNAGELVDRLRAALAATLGAQAAATFPSLAAPPVVTGQSVPTGAAGRS